MSNHKSSSTAQVCEVQVADETGAEPQYQSRKPSGALDVHAASIVVARMVEGAERLETAGGRLEVASAETPVCSLRPPVDPGRWLVERLQVFRELILKVATRRGEEDRPRPLAARFPSFQ
jgi:hypothetical protein